MKLYYLPGACSLADHIVLEWIGKPYDTQKMTREGIKSPEYLKMNPAGAVPVLQDDDGWTLTENVAILGYLADMNPHATLLGNGTPRGRAEVMRWLAYLNSDVHKAFLPLFGPGRLIKDESQHEELQHKARDRIRTLLAPLDRQLNGKEWITGQRSLADPYLFVILRWAKKFEIDLQDYSNLSRFVEHIQKDAGVQKALQKEGLS